MPLVLLIEDHHDIAAMVGDHLESEGYEVDYAADGVTGLHLAVTGEVFSPSAYRGARALLVDAPGLVPRAVELPRAGGTRDAGEIALAAGRSLGCLHVDELTLEAPLHLPEQGAVPIQVQVAAPDARPRGDRVARPGELENRLLGS